MKELNEYKSVDRKNNRRQKLQQSEYVDRWPYSLFSVAEFQEKSADVDSSSHLGDLVEKYCGDQITQTRQLLLQYPRSNSQRILLDVLKLS